MILELRRLVAWGCVNAYRRVAWTWGLYHEKNRHRHLGTHRCPFVRSQQPECVFFRHDKGTRSAPIGFAAI